MRGLHVAPVKQELPASFGRRCLHTAPVARVHGACNQKTAFERGLKEMGIPLTREMFSLRVDSDPARANALRAGYGLGLCQIGVARKSPDLVHLLPKAIRIDLPLWLVMHKDLKDTRRVRLLFDHLVEGLTAFAATS